MGVLRAENQQGAGVLMDEGAGPADGVGEVEGELFGRLGLPGFDVYDRPDDECRDNVVVAGEAVLGVQRRPRTVLFALSDARGVFRGRRLEPKMLPLLLRPICSRIGPLTTVNGAVPVVDCQIPRRGCGSWAIASHAEMTTGKYSGRQPASAALIAANRTVNSRLRCGTSNSTSSGSRPVRARNSAR
jgi:hypothetical protein